MITRFSTLAENALTPGMLPAFGVELRQRISRILSWVGRLSPTPTPIAAASMLRARYVDKPQYSRHFRPLGPAKTAIHLQTLSFSLNGVAGIHASGPGSMPQPAFSNLQSLHSLTTNFGTSNDSQNHTSRRGVSDLQRSLHIRIRPAVGNRLTADRTNFLGRQERTNDHEENHADQCIANRRMSDCDRRRRAA